MIVFESREHTAQVARFGGVRASEARTALRWWHDSHVDVWARVDALIDRAPSEHDLQSHRLELLAARRFRQLDRRVPEDFAAAERFSAVALLSVPVVLERMRKAYDGPAIIFKGPEVAAAYADPILRSFGDLDLLVPDPAAVSRALQGAGFELVGDPELYVDIHHLRPLVIPGVPLPIELHSVPKWIEGRTPPPAAELFESAVPSASRTADLSTLAREEHVLILAAHSWAHEPLRRLRDMVDVAAMLDAADLDAVARLARRWGVGRLWATTLATVEALFGDRTTPWALRLWAQNLDRARERTVLENHTQRWLSDFWVLPPPVSLRRLPRRFASEFGPAADEGWREKLSRARLAVSHASRPRSQHDRELDERGR